jgi:hypothetical protein
MRRLDMEATRSLVFSRLSAATACRRIWASRCGVSRDRLSPPEPPSTAAVLSPKPVRQLKTSLPSYEDELDMQMLLRAPI